MKHPARGWGCHSLPYTGMSTHHCCDPAHRDYDATLDRLRRRMQDAEARAVWAETNETVIAEALGRARDEIEALRSTRR